MKKQESPASHVKASVNDMEAEELKTLTEFILSKIDTEKIICFGSTVSSIKNNSCFAADTKYIKSKLNSYYLLVVPKATECIADITIQQKLEEKMKLTASVTVLVHRMEEINKALQSGSSFFTTLYRKGILLHDNEAEPFVFPSSGEEISRRITRREEFWKRWFLLSENFLKGAHFYCREKDNNLAVFMLNQTLQHCYSGMLRVLTGYRSNSNSLRRLLKLIENILPDASFSEKHTPENARLSGLLMKGFSDARYSDKFNITTEELGMLMNKIEKILKEGNTACIDHLKNLREGKTSIA